MSPVSPRSFALCACFFALALLLNGCGSDSTDPPNPPPADSGADSSQSVDAARDAGADLLLIDAGLDLARVDAGDAAMDVPRVDAGDAAPSDGALAEAGTDSLIPDLLAPDLAWPQEEACADGQDNDGDSLVDCADPDCDKRPCREQQGLCDALELCENLACPADALKPAEATCRAGGPCDLEEKCDGVSPDCPVDRLAPANAICRASYGPCDPAELCDGAHRDCPLDLYAGQGTLCRPADSVCDVAEVCDGLSPECPADEVAAAGTACRPVAGPCDVEETCDGLQPDCPADAYDISGSECRPSAGTCDTAEHCSGSSPDCPPDVLGCLPGQYCDGSQCLDQKAQGAACQTETECASGICADGTCCDRACGGICRSCSVSGQEGTCIDHADGTSPEGPCSGNYSCNGSGGCRSACAGTYGMGCADGYVCIDSGPLGTRCYKKRDDGATCFDARECASGICTDEGYCCSTACGTCRTCASGTCVDKPAGASDPACAVCQECASGACVTKADGASDSRCGPCKECQSGACANKPDGVSDPGCDGYRCAAGACKTSCVADAWNCSADCDDAYWCWDSKCEPDLPGGSGCLGGCQCQSNSCVFFVCW